MPDQPPSSEDSGPADPVAAGDDPYWPGRPTTPRRWRQLFHEVGVGIFSHSQDPSYPFAKIGHYDAEGVLGNGSHGVVYKVRDVDLDRLLALKICTVESEAATKALMAEARTLAKLSHPNIITIHGTGTHNGDRFFVMEFIDGLTLHKYAFEAGEEAPGWEGLVEMFCTLGLALAAAHGEDVIHGDFKPANVMLERETLKPYIVDFGLARVRGGEQGDEGGRGTLHYSAPEVLRGELGDARSDQYSFCVSLWQCLDDGPTPYGGHDSEDLLIDIEAGSPPFDNLDVSERVRDVLRKGMSFEAGDRYPDMEALVRDLRLALGPRLVPSAEVEPASKPRSDRGKDILFVGMLLLTAAVLLRGLRPRVETGGAQVLEQSLSAKRGCAASPWAPGSAALGVCTSIRLGNFDGADELWRATHDKAHPSSFAEWEALIHDSLSVSMTFAAEKEWSLAGEWCSTARDDYASARESGLQEEAEEKLSSAIEQAGCN